MSSPSRFATPDLPDQAESLKAGNDVDLRLVGVSKSFGAVHALKDCTIDVRRNEILALLGPSGCGKSTLLNIVAGFLDPDAGDVWLRGRHVNDVPPNRRNTGMVFQHYALFPHMTVRQNISYGLHARKLAADVIDERVKEMMNLLKFEGLEERYPEALSGGQKQRVAVARALAIHPDVLLLDEALSALDKNLREEMQIELSLLLRRLGITTILVTHDQQEAFTLGDRIALMEHGRIIQVGQPEDIYLKPQSKFVVEFMGSANRLSGTVEQAEEGDGVVRTRCGFVFPIPPGSPGWPIPPGSPGKNAGRPVLAYVRAEDLTLSHEPTTVHAGAPARIVLVTFLGAKSRFVIELGDDQILVERSGGDGPAGFAEGDNVYVSFPPERCHVVPDD